MRILKLQKYTTPPSVCKRKAQKDAVVRGCPQLRADTANSRPADGGAHVQAEDELRDEIRRQYDALEGGIGS